jgi:hypothetical protein
LELPNAFDCVSQKENILLNTENKRIIGLTGLGYHCVYSRSFFNLLQHI